MKFLITILIALALVCPTTGQTIKDSLGNQISLYQWVWFNSNAPFHHPNSHDYKNVWVYAKPRRYSNFQGWLTVTGLAWGIQDAASHHYLKNWGGSWNNVWRFSARLGVGYLVGWGLDKLKAKGRPKGYVYLIRNPRTQ